MLCALGPRPIEKSDIQKKRIIFSFTLKSKNINFSLFNPYYRELKNKEPIGELENLNRSEDAVDLFYRIHLIE